MQPDDGGPVNQPPAPTKPSSATMLAVLVAAIVLLWVLL
jgi:hypothetical protein